MSALADSKVLREVLGGLSISKLGIYYPAVTSMQVKFSLVTMLSTYPNITLSVEQGVKP